MDWQRTSVVHAVVKTDTKPEVPVPSTEGMPPLSDITKHKGKRRNRTGSLNAHYTVSEPREQRDNNSFPKMPPLTRIRRTPITGGSWDDNSVGHGSVVSRMRRERNRAILRTQSSMTHPLHHSVDTHANVTSTLNLINTTSLSPLPSDSFHDNSEWLNNYLWDRTPHQSAAAKSSAGSMCNIPVSGYQTQMSHQPWDTLSIPELHSTKSCDRTCHRTHHRHSYSSGYANVSHLHSSPTSGCASIASSDLDSADFMYFNINDDSSYFDGDSLFADSLGIIGDNDTAFSTNILSLLEEGSISCRTPFPASDWPDSISELDFDCSEGKPDDVTNCDALSDIGPSCSSPPQRRRMTKRQSMSHSKPNEVETNFDTDNDEDGAEIDKEEVPDDQPSMTENLPCDLDDLNASTDSIIAKDTQELLTLPTEIPPSAVESSSSLLTHPMTDMTWSSLTNDEKNNYVQKLTSSISVNLSPEEQLDVMQLLSPNIITGTPPSGQISGHEVDFERLSKALKYLEQRRSCVDCDWVLVKSPEQKNGTIKLVKQKKVVKYGTEVQSASYRKQTSAEMDTSDMAALSNGGTAKLRSQSNASAKIFTESAKKYYDTTKYYDDSVKPKLRCPRKFTLDEAAASLRQRIRPGSRQETSSTKSADPQHAESCSDPSCQGCSSNLRRSNSDGNLPKSLGAEAQKEHRRQQRQARRWAKWLKTRQRKEKHQLLKEHRSGLFVNERKVKLKVDCEEEVDIEIS